MRSKNYGYGVPIWELLISTPNFTDNDAPCLIAVWGNSTRLARQTRWSLDVTIKASTFQLLRSAVGFKMTLARLTRATVFHSLKHSAMDAVKRQGIKQMKNGAGQQARHVAASLVEERNYVFLLMRRQQRRSEAGGQSDHSIASREDPVSGQGQGNAMKATANHAPRLTYRL